jgi:hypothetical protein
VELNKVIVELHLDFSEESDKALRTLFVVAEELLDQYNLWVEIVPVHVWFQNPLEAELEDLPKIYINGKLRFIGRAPTKTEAIKAILEHAKLPPVKSTQSIIVTSKIDLDGGLPEVSTTS